MLYFQGLRPQSFPWTAAEYPLNDLLKSPAVTITRCEADGDDAVLELTYIDNLRGLGVHELWGAPEGHGQDIDLTVRCLGSQRWAVGGYTLKIESKGIIQTVTHTYGVSRTLGVPRLLATTDETTFRGGEDTISVDFSRYESAEPEPRDLYLSAYGVPEPAGVTVPADRADAPTEIVPAGSEVDRDPSVPAAFPAVTAAAPAGGQSRFGWLLAVGVGCLAAGAFLLRRRLQTA